MLKTLEGRVTGFLLCMPLGVAISSWDWSLAYEWTEELSLEDPTIVDRLSHCKLDSSCVVAAQFLLGLLGAEAVDVLFGLRCIGFPVEPVASCDWSTSPWSSSLSF